VASSETSCFLGFGIHPPDVGYDYDLTRIDLNGKSGIILRMTVQKIGLRLGTVTEGHIPEPNYEIYCESRSDWFSENTQRPNYEQNKA
jgi:hypothetical protein